MAKDRSRRRGGCDREAHGIGAKAVFCRREERNCRGGKSHSVSPKTVPQENQDKLIIYVHGGGYILANGGEGSVPEAMAMAHYGKFKVISVDYRMLPDYPFPAGLDDVVAVYKDALKTYKPKNIAFFGTSAGSGLAAAAMLKFRELNLPLPSVIGLGTPFADVTKTSELLLRIRISIIS